MDSGKLATKHQNEKLIERKRIKTTLRGEFDMKAKAVGMGKGWLDRKLASSKFRKGFEEELQKLAIGEQLARLRLEAGLTQAQVAKRTGTTASAISRYENSEYDRYELRTLQKIVRACGGRLEISLEPGPKTHRAA
jgi:DNA-binding XRE family transcriptional regulator